MSAELREKCGVFGAFGADFEAARIAFFGLFSLQHRGQESAGISASDGFEIRTYKDQGLVAHVFDEDILRKLTGYVSLGHVRYSTSGGSKIEYAQPFVDPEGTLALAHNGNIPNIEPIERFLDAKGISINGLNDSGLMHRCLLYHLKKGASLEESVINSFDLFDGAFSLILMTKDKLAAVRDRWGIRPLAMGRLNGGYIFASESCALDTLGADFVRDIRPGEMVVVDENKTQSYQIREGRLKICSFEYIYFARPDSTIEGINIAAAREKMGERLALEHPLEADVIVAVPDSAIPATYGYSKISGIPITSALVKNRYIHRTFIEPEQHQRERDVELKINVVKELVKGKEVIVIDDSIVRGTTTRRIVWKIREVGEAKSVKVLVHSPPFRYRDPYGIDAQRHEELIAANMTIDDIRRFIGVDYLGYLSLEGLIESIGLPKENITTHCFDGNYPINLSSYYLKQVLAI